MEEIEQSLIHNDGKQYFGIDDFENLFERKKEVVESINQFRAQNKDSKAGILKAQQRLTQI